MSYTILHTSEGQLVGVHPNAEEAGLLSLPGVSRIYVSEDIPDLNFVRWDVETLSLVSTQRHLTKRLFLDRFTATEYAAIKAASLASPDVDFYWQKLVLSDYVDLELPLTQLGVRTMEALGLLGAGRADEVLA